VEKKGERFFSVRPGVPCISEPRLIAMKKRMEFGDVLESLFGKSPPIYGDDLATLLNSASIIDDAMRNIAFFNANTRCILEVSRDRNGLFCPSSFNVPHSLDGLVNFEPEGDDLVVAVQFAVNTFVMSHLCIRWWSFTGEDFEPNKVFFLRNANDDYIARVHEGARRSVLIVLADIEE
jgi:hypothetical protein